MGLILGLVMGLGLILVASPFLSPDDFSHLRIRSKQNRPAKISTPHVWSDLVDDLASAVRAGVALPVAFAALADSGPIEIRQALQQTVLRYQVTGDFVNALSVFKDSCKNPQCDKIVGALTIAHSVGGTDLGLLLRTLAEALRDDAKVRSEIVARQSWTVNGARLAVAAPWVTVLLLSTHSDAWSAYTSSAGRILMFMCALASIVAYFLMRQIGKLPAESRLSQ